MINREIIYERNLTGSFMKIAAPPDAGLDETLLLRRKLPGLLPVEKAYVDGCGQYWYNISGKQSLDTYCRVKNIGMAFIERLIISICSEMEILEWNLIRTGCLMLDPELVFITNCNQEIIFTVYPGGSGTVETEFEQLMEYLLTKIDHKDDLAVRSAYGIYEKTLMEGYSLTDIRDEIGKERQKAPAPEPKPLPVPPKAPAPSVSASAEPVRKAQPQSKRQPRRQKPAEPQQKLRWLEKLTVWLTDMGILEEDEKPTKKKPHRPKKEKNPAPTPVYPDEAPVVAPEPLYHPTVCLNAAGKPRGMLLYQGSEPYENIDINRRTLCIGYGEQADVCIRHDTISQLHARVGSAEDGYYIEDLNSTNGTFVNEEPLAYKQRRKLNAGDIVCLADLRYRFC